MFYKQRRTACYDARFRDGTQERPGHRGQCSGVYPVASRGGTHTTIASPVREAPQTKPKQGRPRPSHLQMGSDLAAATDGQRRRFVQAIWSPQPGRTEEASGRTQNVCVSLWLKLSDSLLSLHHASKINIFGHYSIASIASLIIDRQML